MMKRFCIIMFFVYIFSFIVKADADLEKQIEEMRAEIEALAEAVEEGASGGGEAGWWTKTSLGGYVEIHWSNISKPVDTKVTRSTSSPSN